MDARERYISTTKGGYSKPGTTTGTTTSTGGGTSTTSTDESKDKVKQDARSTFLANQAKEAVNKYYSGIAKAMQGSGLEGWTVKDLDRRGSGVPGDKGALLSDLEKMKVLAQGSGKGLGSFIAVDSSGKPMYTSEGNLIYTGLGTHLQDQWGKSIDAFAGGTGETFLDEEIDRYWKQRHAFDQSWSGMDDFDQSFYGPGGPTEVSETFAGAPWMQKGLGEIIAEGPKGFGEMESIYGEEFDPSREASWLYLTGIPQFSDQTIYDYA
jgi:hypothetical protein